MKVFRFPNSWFVTALGFAAVALVAIAGCNGKADDESGVGAGGTGPGAASIGPITGFGSIYVGGIRFQDDAADIRSDDGQRLSRDQLDLGMWVEVLGSFPSEGASARADSVRVAPAVRGTVSALDAEKGTLNVLGLTVDIKTGTVIGNDAGLTSLKVGDAVSIYGALDTRQMRVTATRVERASLGGIGNAPFVLRGAITELTATKLRLGTLTIDIQNARIEAPQGLGVGTVVTVASTFAPEGLTWQATRLRAIGSPASAASAALDVTLDGVVSEFATLASLRIDDTLINANSAQVRDGNPGDIRLGTRLAVRGSVVAGVLVASEIRLLGSASPMPYPIIAVGSVADFIAIANFRVRNTYIDASAAVVSNGAAADLTNGRRIEARGQIVNGRLQATQVTVLP